MITAFKREDRCRIRRPARSGAAAGATPTQLPSVHLHSPGVTLGGDTIIVAASASHSRSYWHAAAATPMRALKKPVAVNPVIF
eukprot:SAG22_NODE_125_length_18883_cov_12.351629_21_plen_83_part_00